MPLIKDFFSVLPLGSDLFTLVRHGAVRRLTASQPLVQKRWLVRLALILEKKSSREKQPSLAKVFAELGPNWVKLGQFLATRNDILGHEAAGDLAALQDKLQPFDQEIAEATLVQLLGKPIKEVFSEFSPPVAAASIAQVHRARLLPEAEGAEGTEVAVKILRPDIRTRFNRDLDRFGALARLAEAFLPSLDRLQPTQAIERLRASVKLEMDLRMEAAALSEFAELVAEDSTFRVPPVHWRQSGRDVLTISWVSAMPMSLYLHHFSHAARKLDRNKNVPEAYQGHADLDPRTIAGNLMRAFLRQALVAGLFHADMHPGNLFVDHDGSLIGIDFGITERMDRHQRRYLAEILYGFLTGQYQRVAEVHFEAGYVPAHHRKEDFAMAARAIAEPIRGQSASEISMADLLGLLFEVTEIFDMKTRPELMLLHKTMVIVEGVCRDLDPNFDMWATSEPVLKAWIEGHFRPDHQLKEARDEALHLARQLGTLPELLHRGAGIAGALARSAENGLSIDPRSLEELSSSLRGPRPFFTRPLGIALLVLAGLIVGLWL